MKIPTPFLILSENKLLNGKNSFVLLGQKSFPNMILDHLFLNPLLY